MQTRTGWVLLVMVLGCSSGSGRAAPHDTPNGDAGSDRPSVAPVDAEAVAKICQPFSLAGELTEQCCSPEELNAPGGWVVAVTTLAAECEVWLSARIASGRVAIDTDLLAQCGSLPDEPACNDLVTGEVELCSAALTGLGGVGDPCLFAIECSQGLACLDYSSVKVGTCGPPPAVGETCYPLASGLETKHLLDGWLGPRPLCESGARCSNYVLGSNGHCIERSTEGESCIGDDACLAPLHCSLGVCSAGARAPSGPGGACAHDDDCAPDLACDSSRDPATCIARRSAGEPCELGSGVCKGSCIQAGDAGVCASYCGSG